MKRLAILLLLVGCVLPLAPRAQAQDDEHVQVGVFADYLRLSQTGNTNFGGVGARAGFQLYKELKLEGPSQ